MSKNELKRLFKGFKIEWKIDLGFAIMYNLTTGDKTQIITYVLNNPYSETWKEKTPKYEGYYGKKYKKWDENYIKRFELLTNFFESLGYWEENQI